MSKASFEEYRDILDAIHRYKVGQDILDWKMVRSAFADEIVFDNPVGGNGQEVLSLAEYIDYLRIIGTGQDSGQHVFSSPVLTIEGDDAVVIGHFNAEHLYTGSGVDPWYTVGATQTITLKRVGGNWRIVGLKLEPLWFKGNKEVVALSWKRGCQRLIEQGEPPLQRVLDRHRFS